MQLTNADRYKKKYENFIHQSHWTLVQKDLPKTCWYGVRKNFKRYLFCICISQQIKIIYLRSVELIWWDILKATSHFPQSNQFSSSDILQLCTRTKVIWLRQQPYSTDHWEEKRNSLIEKGRLKSHKVSNCITQERFSMHDRHRLWHSIITHCLQTSNGIENIMILNPGF